MAQTWEVNSALPAVVSGNFLYVVGNHGLQVVNISDPQHPAVVGQLSVEGTFYHMAIANNIAYLIDGDYNMQIVDIGDPLSPSLAGQVALTPDAHDIVLDGSKIYAPSADAVHILDVSNADTPVLIGRLGMPLGGFTLSSLAVSDKFAIISSGPKQVSVADLSLVGLAVVQSASLPLVDGAPGRISTSGNYAYLQNTNRLDEQRGFAIFDLSDPLSPEWITDFEEIDFLTSVVAAGNYAYFGDAEFGALRTVDISNPSQPFMLDATVYLDDGPMVEELPGIKGLVLAEVHIYIPWGHRAYDDGSGVGLGEWGCTNPDVEGGVGGLFTIDISMPATPALAGHICMPEQALAVAVGDTHAYVALADASMQLVNINDPAQPSLAGNVNLAGTANFLAVNDTTVWTAKGGNGVQIFDVSDPAIPALSATINTPGFTNSIVFDDRYAYVADGASGVLIFDNTNPAEPMLIGGANTRGKVFSLLLVGDYLYAATGYGIEVFKAMPTPEEASDQ